MTSWLQDLRSAARSLAQAPAFSALVVATLAVCIGATTGIYSVVHGALIKAPPYSGYERLVMMPRQLDSTGGLAYYVSHQDYRDWKDRLSTVERLEGIHLGVATLKRPEQAQRVFVRYVTPGFLELFGASASMGRMFGAADDERPSGHPVAVITHGLWQREYAGHSDVIGLELNLSGVTYSVIGVLNPEFEYPFGQEIGTSVDIWLPAMMASHSHPFGEAIFSDRSRVAFTVVGRMRQGIDVGATSEELTGIVADLAERFPETNRGFQSVVHRLDDMTRGQSRGPLWLLLAGSAVLLAVGCINVANLMLARGAERRGEMSLRMALGASRAQLLRYLACESLLLAALGGGLGVLAAAITLPALVRLVSGALSVAAAQLPPASDIAVNTPVLVMASTITLLASFLFGVLPAARASRGSLRGAMISSERLGASRSATRARDTLVVAQIATATVLLSFSAVLVRGFQELRAAELDINLDRAIHLQIDPPRGSYPDEASISRLTKDVHGALAAVSGVDSAAVWGPGQPGFTSGRATLLPEGANPDDTNAAFRARSHQVSAGAMQQLDIALTHGRPFREDDQADSMPVAIVSSTLAERAWPGRGAIGQRFTSTMPSAITADAGVIWTVIGVAADVDLGGRLPTLNAIPTPDDLYFPATQRPLSMPQFVVRTAGPPAREALQAAIAAIDPNIPVFGVSTSAQLLARQEGPSRFSSLLMTVFASAALFLAALGVYGALAYAIAGQTREIGLRAALGARRGQTLGLFISRELKLGAIGVTLGALAASWLSGSVASQVTGLPNRDLVAVGIASLLLTAVTGLASWLPARRATRIDPIAALRE